MSAAKPVVRMLVRRARGLSSRRSCSLTQTDARDAQRFGDTGLGLAPQARPLSKAELRDELRKAGWTERRNVDIETRWAAMNVESMRRLAKELVGLQPDLILTSSTPAAGAVLQQTRTIPIVFVLVADPVGSGYVASVPRPGGNMTGFTPIAGSLGGKWVQLLKEIAPRVVRVT